MKKESKYEEFIRIATERGYDYYRQDIKGNGGFDYNEQVSDLINFSNKVNSKLLIYLFGEQLGTHLAEKFVVDCKRDLLKLFGKINSEMKFFILHQIKTNKELYSNC